MEKVRIGQVGLGRLGLEHARNIASRVPFAELAALCDVDAAKLAETAEELGVAGTYGNFDEMCADEELDAIAVVSPSALHAGQIKTAMEQGKHVFCEKPLDTTLERCRKAE